MELPPRAAVRFARAPLSPGRFRYWMQAAVAHHQDLVLRAPDGEVVVRRSGRRAVDGVVTTAWTDERPDLTADVVTIG